MAEEKNGRWVTLENGTHLFIKNGQTLEEAIKSLDPGRKNIEDKMKKAGWDFKEPDQPGAGVVKDVKLENFDDDYESHFGEDELTDEYLDELFDKYDGDEDAVLDHLRESGKDYGMSNGDLQSVVEAKALKRNSKINQNIMFNKNDTYEEHVAKRDKILNGSNNDDSKAAAYEAAKSIGLDLDKELAKYGYNLDTMTMEDVNKLFDADKNWNTTAPNVAWVAASYIRNKNKK